MTKDKQDYKMFLEDQLDWCKDQDLILAEIEQKLREMKEIATTALEFGVTKTEVELMNQRLNLLKLEIAFLNSKLQTIVN